MSIQSDLNERLGKAAAEGRLDDVLDALAKGAEIDGVNERKRTALMRASFRGHIHVVEVLLAAGADRTLRDSVVETAMDDARNKNHDAIVDLLQTYEMKKPVDEITFTRKMGDRTLQEVFNFSTLERISLIRLSVLGKIEAMAVTPFSAIENKSDTSLLRQAFNEHRQRGGMADELLVFPYTRARLPKTGGGPA